jgi:Phage terminase, small subunit
MARPRSPNRDKAFKIYKRQKGNISNKEISEILGEDPKTVSKWKKLDKWEEKVPFAKAKKNNSKNKESNPSFNANFENETIDFEIEKEINQIQEVEEMNEKHLLFCIYYIQCFNATKAYQKAYQCGKNTAMVNGCKLLSKTNIQVAIAKLKQNRLNRAMISPEDIFQKYLDIAHADITDYITFGQQDILVGNDKNGLPVYKKVSFLDFKNSEDIDGTLITEFKEGKNGFSIKLMDRLKALNWLGEHMDLATEEQRTRVESLKSKIKIENETMELKKKEFERNDF